MSTTTTPLPDPNNYIPPVIGETLNDLSTEARTRVDDVFNPRNTAIDTEINWSELEKSQIGDCLMLTNTLAVEYEGAVRALYDEGDDYALAA